MKILLMDSNLYGLDLALRCKDAGHDVRLWLPTKKGGDAYTIGDGMVDKPAEWKPSMNWADLIVLTDNSVYRSELKPYFDKGYPIFGAPDEGAQLELDREKGQQAFEDCGIDTLPFETFTDYDKAIKHVIKTRKAYACKPWGGASDKALSYVASTPEDMVFQLERWKKDGLKGQFMLQEKIDGIEMGVSGWFGPSGFLSAIEEDWEEKKLMNDGLGVNTGEQGTILRYVKKSKLFDELLSPLEDYLHSIDYVGNINVNAAIDKDGKPWPFEFTTRLGWPATHLEVSLHQGDPAEWMLDCIEGRDTLEVSDDVCVGVVLSHGDYPNGDRTGRHFEDYPVRGITTENRENLHFCEMKEGKAPAEVGGTIKYVSMPVTAGDYVLVTTGCAGTVKSAADIAYDTIWEINGLCNRQFRTDIGKRLKKELPKLQAFGYADGMEY